MSSSRLKSIFISYRRNDSSSAVLRLSETISQNFGKSSVFIDTSVIEIPSEWPKQIERALAKASVLVAVIGPGWLKDYDQYGKRRIDDEHDWVNREISNALNNKIPIIPLLVEGADLPSREGLPSNLRALLKFQAFELRRGVRQWETDMEEFLDRLQKLGFKRKSPQIKYPQPSDTKGQELTEHELKGVLKALPEWTLDDSRSGPGGTKKIELMRTYEFNSFEEAIHYMATASRYIAKVDHHPDWANVWKTITVWLTTWDLGHKPSRHDVSLAKYMDKLYQDYNPRKSEVAEAPRRPFRHHTRK